jgi:hypothetical protein
MDLIQIAIAPSRRPEMRKLGQGMLLRQNSFIADQRGAVSFETLIVIAFLMFSLLLPLADVAVAAFKFISAWEALRGFGQSIQYNTPPDVTNASTWESTALAKADPNFPISNFKLVCGNSKGACSTTNLGPPQYYSYTTTVTLTPMVLKWAFCGKSCTFTLLYSERFK